MLSSNLVALATFCFAAAITPGPNNTLALSSGVNFGYRRTIPHLLGITLGFAAMLLALGFGLGGLLRAYPSAHDVLRVVSTAYILWLAWKIASSGSLGEVRSVKSPMTFLQAAAFQWVNPKGWASGLGALGVYVPPDDAFFGTLVVASVFAAIMYPCISIWTVFGVALRRILSRPSMLRTFNVSMAILLLASLYPIWFAV